MTIVQNIVISLKGAGKRREHITNEFSNKNVNFEFFDALTPDLAQPLAKKMNLNVQEDSLSQGELACFMSHVSIWQKMLDDKIPYLSIFEDDVYLGENAAKVLNDLSWINPLWNIIKTEAFATKVFLGKTIFPILDGQRRIVQLKGKNLGTAGYILTLKGAQIYLDYIKSRPLIALDQLMFDDFITKDKNDVFQMSPAICIQEMMLFPKQELNLSSDLLVQRQERMKKQKKKGWGKIKLELFRILKQIKYAVLAKMIEFK